MKNGNIKADARAMIERLHDDATWDDLMHEIYVRQAIESGIADSDAGRAIEISELRRKLGLVPPSSSTTAS